MTALLVALSALIALAIAYYIFKAELILDDVSYKSKYKVDDLDVSSATKTALKKAGYTEVWELPTSVESLCKINRISTKRAKQIIKAIEKV